MFRTFSSDSCDTTTTHPAKQRRCTHGMHHTVYDFMSIDDLCFVLISFCLFSLFAWWCYRDAPRKATALYARHATSFYWSHWISIWYYHDAPRKTTALYAWHVPRFIINGILRPRVCLHLFLEGRCYRDAPRKTTALNARHASSSVHWNFIRF